MGNRSLDYWLTALAAHASDMSNWLFMDYPAIILMGGLFNCWVAIGLTLCMLLNWQYVAPKIRLATEKYQSLTLSSYFEKRLKDHSGALRLASGAICFFFYTIYLACRTDGTWYSWRKPVWNLLPGRNPLGDCHCGRICFIVGGFVTLAWLDLFQGLFLLLVIIFIPLYVLHGLGGFSEMIQTLQTRNLTLSLFPDFSPATLFTILSISLT